MKNHHFQAKGSRGILRDGWSYSRTKNCPTVLHWKLAALLRQLHPSQDQGRHRVGLQGPECRYCWARIFYQSITFYSQTSASTPLLPWQGPPTTGCLPGSLISATERSLTPPWKRPTSLGFSTSLVWNISIPHFLAPTPVCEWVSQWVLIAVTSAELVSM